MTEKIFVTRPSLPPLENFIPYLKKIWDSRILTNKGPFHEQFEEKLAEFLGVKYVSLFANGTLALLTALQALEIEGEVITTPYTFVATANALWWNKLTPVFVDIEPVYCNLDADKIEEAITSKTSAILPVHVYGNPCEVERIQAIADRHNLKVIYDAAHAFGVKYKGQSLLNYGDLSILSFHATKVFNTMEGGAIISHSAEMKKRIDHLKNFGFENEESVVAPGINSKMNEMQAALGLLQLKYHKKNIKKRKLIADAYIEALKSVKGISFLPINPHVENFNYSYFPIFVNKNEYGLSRDALYNKLREKRIFARRYFYPLISDLLIYKKNIKSNNNIFEIAKRISNSVLCLPIYPDMNYETQAHIQEIIIQ